MPHRKSPSGVARNYILHNAQFDRLIKESINTVDDGDVLAELGRAFPDEAPTSAVFPKGFIGIKGLVLNDTYGTGALEPVGRPKQETITSFMISQREGAFQ